MSELRRDGETAPHAGAVVGRAIQDLTVARLGRGFVPLAVLFAAGAVGVLRASSAGWWTALGALATSAVMLAYGLRTVQRTFGRDHRTWMSAALVGSVVPPIYGVYVLGWRGLRELATGGGWPELTAAIVFTGMGVWVLHTWLRIVEVERLARVMTSNVDGDGGGAG